MAPAPFQPKPVDLAPLEAYTRALARPRSHEKDAAIVGIITIPVFEMAQPAREAVLDVKKSLADEKANRHFFGFFVRRGEQWQSEMNGALPTILAKWLAAAETAPVSPILPMHLASDRPVYQLRETFQTILTETMDADYLAMLDALYASQAQGMLIERRRSVNDPNETADALYSTIMSEKAPPGAGKDMINMYRSIFNEAQAMQDTLSAWRRQLHQTPELGLELPQTSAFIQQELTKMGVPFKTLVDGNCVVAQLGQGEKCLMLRADMDALPMREEADVDFAATNGNMHACGHDMHATSLLGAAKILKAHESELKGTIKLFFQPGEEVFAGALAAIDDGLFEAPRVDAAVATHVASIAPVGTVVYGKAPNAGAFIFEITIKGKGTHGAMPELGVDPINTAVHIHLALQELLAREVPAGKELTLTIGELHAGTACNIVPDTAFMSGTMRVFDDALRKQMIARFKEVVAAVAHAYRSEVEIKVLSDLPPLYCDSDLQNALAGVIAGMSPDIHLLEGLHNMASEDFAYISQKVPSAFFTIGAEVEDGPVYNQHHPKVCFNEKALPVETAVYAACALSWQREGV